MTDPKLTPPPELVRKWNQDAIGTHFEPYGYSEFIATRAAQWGADKELEACCEWLIQGWDNIKADKLRAARRSKPPTLKEQALAALETEPEDAKELIVFDMDQIDIIRRALEALPND